MNHLRPDLDQLVAQRRERPLLHTRWQRQLAQEVAQVVRIPWLCLLEYRRSPRSQWELVALELEQTFVQDSN